MRKLYTWKLRSRELRLGDRTLIVAVLNLTPDSFTEDGIYDNPDLAVARAIELEAMGADILDIGAESTKPGSVRISAAEELRRLIPVLKRLKEQLSIPISVDTYKAEVATLALEHGAEIINDPSGFTFDPLLAKVVVENDAGLILNHMRGTPETWAKMPPLPDVMAAVSKDLDASANRARRSGVDKNRIVLDPGLGFGKRKEQNSEIIARLAELANLEYPILTGPSRKSFLAQGTEEETIYATAAAVAASVLNGAHLVRVHDVAAMKAVIAVSDEIAKGERGFEEEPVKRPVGRRVASPETAATERPSPTRPPLLKNFAPPPPEISEVHPSMEDDSEQEEKPAWRPPVERGGERPYSPRKSGPPSDRGDRPFTPRRSGPPSDRGDRPFAPRRSGPPSDRGDRPFPPRRFGPPSDRGDRPFTPRSGPPSDRGDRSFPPRRFGPPSDRGDRPFTPRSGPPSDRGDRPFPPRRFGPPSDRGDRPFTPRSGPPSDRGDRPFKPRSGPPSDRGDRPFKPRSGPPSDRPFRPRSGPPSDRGDRPFPPRRSGPPSGDRPYKPRSGPPSGGSGPRKFGPPRNSSGPRKDYPSRGPKRDS